MSLAELRSHIGDLARSGESFERIEAAIDATRLTDDQESALWLWAWTLSEISKRR